MRTLKDIGHDQQCDKGNAQHSHAGESYFDIYERFFAPFKDKEINFLELGVRLGKSLRVWREYFTKANISGVDINPASAHQDTPGCIVEICSQDDVAKLDEISQKARGWDIIVDDASHLNVLTAESFKILWKHVRPKGMYIIEDLMVSYGDLSHLPKDWNFVDMHPGNPPRNNDRGILNDIFFGIIRDLDRAKGNVRALHFFHQIVIIEKI